MTVKEDPAQQAQMKSQNAVLIKVLLLKDNDCGVVKSNLAAKAHAAEGLRHMSPVTYRRLVWLNEKIKDPATTDFLKREALFRNADVTSTAAKTWTAS